MSTNIFAKIGAVFYILWGLLHFFAAYAALGPALEGAVTGVAEGRIMQNSIFMAMVSVTAIWIAVQFNWKNDWFGYLFNLFTVTVADLAFIFLILWPGFIPMIPGVLGPALWVIAVIFSTLGIPRPEKTQ